MVRKLLISITLIVGLEKSLYCKDLEFETNLDHHMKIDANQLKYYHNNENKCQAIDEKESQELEAHFKERDVDIEIAYKTQYGYIYAGYILDKETGRLNRFNRAANEEACNLIPEIYEQEKVRLLDLDAKMQDPTLDIEYVNKARQGNDMDQYLIAFAYYNKQDYKEAGKWYKLSAEQGNIGAHYSLGIMYANGQDVKQDFKKAMDLFKKACDGGLEEGCKSYKTLLRKSLGL